MMHVYRCRVLMMGAGCLTLVHVVHTDVACGFGWFRSRPQPTTALMAGKAARHRHRLRS